MDPDVYDDIGDFDFGNEIDKLKTENKMLDEHIESLESDIEKLTATITTLKENQDNLTSNISSLYLTAKAEIDRKDRMIADLREEIDNICFRRRNPNFHFKRKECESNTGEVNDSKRFKSDNTRADDKYHTKVVSEQSNNSKRHSRSRSIEVLDTDDKGHDNRDPDSRSKHGSKERSSSYEKRDHDRVRKTVRSDRCEKRDNDKDRTEPDQSDNICDKVRRRSSIEPLNTDNKGQKKDHHINRAPDSRSKHGDVESSDKHEKRGNDRDRRTPDDRDKDILSIHEGDRGSKERIHKYEDTAREWYHDKDNRNNKMIGSRSRSGSTERLDRYNDKDNKNSKMIGSRSRSGSTERLDRYSDSRRYNERTDRYDDKGRNYDFRGRRGRFFDRGRRFRGRGGGCGDRWSINRRDYESYIAGTDQERWNNNADYRNRRDDGRYRKYNDTWGSDMREDENSRRFVDRERWYENTDERDRRDEQYACKEVWNDDRREDENCRRVDNERRTDYSERRIDERLDNRERWAGERNNKIDEAYGYDEPNYISNYPSDVRRIPLERSNYGPTEMPSLQSEDISDLITRERLRHTRLVQDTNDRDDNVTLPRKRSPDIIMDEKAETNTYSKDVDKKAVIDEKMTPDAFSLESERVVKNKPLKKRLKMLDVMEKKLKKKRSSLPSNLKEKRKQSTINLPLGFDNEYLVLSDTNTEESKSSSGRHSTGSTIKCDEKSVASDQIKRKRINLQEWKNRNKERNSANLSTPEITTVSDSSLKDVEQTKKELLDDPIEKTSITSVGSVHVEKVEEQHKSNTKHFSTAMEKIRKLFSVEATKSEGECSTDESDENEATVKESFRDCKNKLGVQQDLHIKIGDNANEKTKDEHSLKIGDIEEKSHFSSSLKKSSIKSANTVCAEIINKKSMDISTSQKKVEEADKDLLENECEIKNRQLQKKDIKDTHELKLPDSEKRGLCKEDDSKFKISDKKSKAEVIHNIHKASDNSNAQLEGDKKSVPLNSKNNTITKENCTKVLINSDENVNKVNIKKKAGTQQSKMEESKCKDIVPDGENIRIKDKTCKKIHAERLAKDSSEEHRGKSKSISKLEEIQRPNANKNVFENPSKMDRKNNCSPAIIESKANALESSISTENILGLSVDSRKIDSEQGKLVEKDTYDSKNNTKILKKHHNNTTTEFSSSQTKDNAVGEHKNDKRDNLSTKTNNSATSKGLTKEDIKKTDDRSGKYLAKEDQQKSQETQKEKLDKKAPEVRKSIPPNKEGSKIKNKSMPQLKEPSEAEVKRNNSKINKENIQKPNKLSKKEIEGKETGAEKYQIKEDNQTENKCILSTTKHNKGKIDMETSNSQVQKKNDVQKTDKIIENDDRKAEKIFDLKTDKAGTKKDAQVEEEVKKIHIKKDEQNKKDESKEKLQYKESDTMKDTGQSIKECRRAVTEDKKLKDTTVHPKVNNKSLCVKDGSMEPLPKSKLISKEKLENKGASIHVEISEKVTIVNEIYVIEDEDDTEVSDKNTFTKTGEPANETKTSSTSETLTKSIINPLPTDVKKSKSTGNKDPHKSKECAMKTEVLSSREPIDLRTSNNNKTDHTSEQAISDIIDLTETEMNRGNFKCRVLLTDVNHTALITDSKDLKNKKTVEKTSTQIQDSSTSAETVGDKTDDVDSIYKNLDALIDNCVKQSEVVPSKYPKPVQSLIQSLSDAENKSSIKDTEKQSVKDNGKIKILEDIQIISESSTSNTTASTVKSNNTINTPDKTIRRRRIKPTPVKVERPVCTFENVLVMSKQQSASESKLPETVSPLHLTHEGEIPVLHLEDNHINDLPTECNVNDKNILSLLDTMNISNMECDMTKFKGIPTETVISSREFNLSVSPIKGNSHLTFENVINTVTSTPIREPSGSEVRESVKTVEDLSNSKTPVVRTASKDSDKPACTSLPTLITPVRRRRRCRLIIKD